jgi:hypothetical protein
MNIHKSDDIKSVTDEQFTPKEKYFLEKTKNYFSADRKYVMAMLEIINGESNISLRILDWFVTNYSKKKNTVYRININNTDNIFNVNIEYKCQLKGHTKTYFDPFCRKKRVNYFYNDAGRDINFISSIGQLNFFQWAIHNKIIEYVREHIDDINNDMKIYNEKREKRIIHCEINIPIPLSQVSQSV